MSSRSVDETKQLLAGVFDRAAPTYDHVGPSYHEHFGRSLVELAEIAPGARVLDVACGRGAVLVPAASHVGVSGHVVGVDISEEMIRLARQALDKAELTNGETRVMDAESLASPTDRSTPFCVGSESSSSRTPSAPPPSSCGFLDQTGPWECPPGPRRILVGRGSAI